MLKYRSNLSPRRKPELFLHRRLGDATLTRAVAPGARKPVPATRSKRCQGLPIVQPAAAPWFHKVGLVLRLVVFSDNTQLRAEIASRRIAFFMSVAHSPRVLSLYLPVLSFFRTPRR